MSRKPVNGAYSPNNSQKIQTINNRRQNMKYKVSTSSTTASGVVPIRGATKYPNEPIIYFTRETWVKQCHLIKKCNQEVGWFALVDYDEKENSFTISELVIPNQEVTAAETNIGKEDLADAAMELIEQGKNTSKMYAWFHSHVNMGVSPSAQDEFQVEDFLEDLADQPEVPAFIRGIQNKKGDLKLDVYYIQHGVAYQNVKYDVLYDDDPAWLDDIEQQIKNKVQQKYNQYYGGAYGGGRNNVGKFQTPQYNDVIGGGVYDRGYGGFNVYDNYDDEWEECYGVYEYTDTKENDDLIAVPPKPVELPNKKTLEMDIVYQTADNMEVLLDNQGKLWVCDDCGDMYDYGEYTEYYGEIDPYQNLNNHQLPIIT